MGEESCCPHNRLSLMPLSGVLPVHAHLVVYSVTKYMPYLAMVTAKCCIWLLDMASPIATKKNANSTLPFVSPLDAPRMSFNISDTVYSTTVVFRSDSAPDAYTLSCDLLSAVSWLVLPICSVAMITFCVSHDGFSRMMRIMEWTLAPLWWCFRKYKEWRVFGEFCRFVVILAKFVWKVSSHTMPLVGLCHFNASVNEYLNIDPASLCLHAIFEFSKMVASIGWSQVTQSEDAA